MLYVVVDLEMNKVETKFYEQRKKCTMEIIEIGAVVLNESYVEVNNFKTYVKPLFNSLIETKIKRLTGISTDMVADAPAFVEAFKMFVNFCKSLNDELVFVEWSTSDHLQIVNEANQKNYLMEDYECELMENWQDFQKEFGEILGVSGQISLENALFYAGEDFIGRQHDALFDARNTARLFAATRIEEKKQVTLEKVIKMLHPEEKKCTMGDLFDFSKIMATVS